MEVKNLEPQELWSNFAALNAVPRASKKEERVIEFMVQYGHSLGLETIQDKTGNVVIKKPATPGMENRQTVIMQSHLDMVHQKNGDRNFDFATQGIEMFVDGDWVRANGTTLGADNGIGVATIMAILASSTIVHPAIEAMFTIDEETGMTGAKELDPSNFTGTILLNLDTEEDDELTIGCAGGIDTNSIYNYKQHPIAKDHLAYQITVKGLLGGHSGMDIHKGRGNANKLMNRILNAALKSSDLQLCTVDGGSLRNAIPRESKAVVAIPAVQKDAFLAAFTDFSAVLKEEYKSIETAMNISIEETELPEHGMAKVDFVKIVNAIYSLPNGVFRMSPDIKDLVEASSNLARVIIKGGEFITQSLQRSSVESTKDDVAFAVGAALENMGCDVSRSGDYPGWKPNADSDILRLMTKLYQTTFNAEPNVNACHAGLECGILGAHLPGMDMISFGPTIHGAHSPDECVKISSVQKFWGYLLQVLQQIPEKK
ncbi:aminoacyl-histidine dipeptidase [Pedobacter gandavensis]|uniref:aminoacyl-histidine dipeptidase n=1 Tax=Pedobacter gandavensis TaxID=2679963 RepID=UPI002479381F|nr:aminoacyl-histidine dipeptidase [Pedobacter gandavensis]WGQ08587.1 aminoacyl-histidine dipeptidase [Pedobacter gandavensis]